MIQIRPFKGLRPTEAMVSEVASPPYDVINSDEAREKVKGHPYSFLHVVKPEIDLDPSIDPHDTQVYQQGAKALRQLIDEKILIQDDKPCFYIYKLRMGEHEQTGLVAVASNEDYLTNKIKKHEHTRPDKETDRAHHIDVLNAQPGPVFLTYRYQEKIDELIKAGMQKSPVYDFVADYDIQHTFYVVDDEALILKIQSEFLKLDALYVADGHHRSAAAARVYQKRRENNPEHTGDEPYNFYLTVIFPDSHMQILDYNRVVKDLNGLTNDQFFEKLKLHFEVSPHVVLNSTDDSAFHPDQMHAFGMYLDKQWYVLKAKESAYVPDDPISVLDVSILQENILSPILGIQNPRTDTRIHFVGGIRGLQELERLVDSGEYKIAFSLYPTTIEQLMDVADANKVMPPKSTWFEPKLRSGLVVHLLD